MNLSPRSTVSSDLYSPEPTKPEGHPSPGLNEPFADKDLQPPSDIAHDGPEESGYSDTMEGLDSPSDPSRSSSAPTSTNIPEISLKRKREHDGDASNTMQGASLSNSQVNVMPFRSRTDSQISMDQAPSQRQPGPSVGDHARIKRSKTRDQTSGLDITAQLFSKTSALPAVLWQHILCYVPPVFLGRLLRVNHAFNTYLTPGKASEDTRILPRSIIQPLKAEDIWLASRKRFAPGLPRPMYGLQDLDMWRLLRGQHCQVCGHNKEAVPAASLDSPWESGPGDSSVRIIWPFGVRCCGSCLQAVSKKEMELFLSTDCPSFLLQALPFAFVSEANHYIAHSALRNVTTSSSLSLTKRYYKPHIEEIKRQFESAKELGTASAEEWIKGLARQGQERLEDLIRWEQWESRGGLKKVNIRPQPKVSTLVGNRIFKTEIHSDRSTPQSMSFSSRLDGGQASPAPFPSEDLAHFGPGPSTPPYQTSWASVTPHLAGTQPGSQVPIYQTRPERNIRDVNEAKASRRAEIERRCADMDPPLMPSVLNHMESFQAATQITQPLTEQAWKVLKPRLLAQLPYAERREKERVQQTEVLAEEYRQRRHQEAQLKETKDNSDREWETFQAPVRNRIGALADEIIETRWAGAKSITKDTSPKFAADVLVNVRQRFYAEIAQEDEAALAAGDPVKIDPSNGPPARRLILENMKWLFDTKIKPLTDHFQRELFLCNGCEGNFKFYGFEGVIQHYAAKHTNTLSMGNIVVHWRAEWPEYPPFNPNPSVAKAAYYKVPTPAPIQSHSLREPHAQANTGGYSQTAETGASVLPQRITENGQYNTNGYSTSYVGPHAEDSSQGFPAQVYPAVTPAYIPCAGYPGYSGYSGPPNGYASSAAHYAPYQNAPHVLAPQTYGSSIPPQSPYPAFAQIQLNTNAQVYVPGSNAKSFASGPYLPNISSSYLPNHVPNVPGPVSDLYQRQMDEMAKHAKDVFTGIGGIKDLPGSVRIYVVIQHTVSRFKATFANEPSLTMFIDGLDHNPVMRPVRSVNGLGCKTCIKFGTSAKLFTLPHLVNHFRTTHVEAPQALGYPQTSELDWKHDMIDLPELSVISNLVHAPGMTDHKLSLIAWAFPEALPIPLPSLRGGMNTGPLPVFRKELDNIARAAPIVAPSSVRDLSTHFEFRSNHQPHNHPENGYRPPSQGPASEPLEPPGEDEYDPHHPLLSKIAEIESGHGHGQPQKLARSSMLQNGHRSSFQVRHESPQYANRTHAELVFDNTSSSHMNHDDSYADQPFERTEPVEMHYSPRPDVTSRSGNRRGLRGSDQNMPQRHKNREEGELPIGYDGSHCREPEDGKLAERWRASQHRQRSLSPLGITDPAEQFLSNIPPKQGSRLTHELYPPDHELTRRSEAPWLDERHPKRRQKHFGEDGTYDQGAAEELNGGEQGNEVPIDHAHADPLQPRKGDDIFTHQRPASGPQYYDNYRSASHMQIPLKSIRSDGSPTVRHAPYEPAQPAAIHERQESNGSALKKPRSGSHPHKGARLQPYGDGAESPHSPIETALYRPRSPVEEDRGDGVCLRSPLLRRQSRPQRVVSYDYQPQTRIEYIDDRGFPESRYQPRVEYIRYEEPVVREPTRYVVARPVEQMQPEYVRYEQTYGDEPVYERNGQLYHHNPQRFYRQ